MTTTQARATTTATTPITSPPSTSRTSVSPHVPTRLREAAAKQQRCVLTFREALLLVAGQKPELQVRVLEALTDLEVARATLATVGDAVESCLVSARVGDEKQAEADAASQSEGGSGVSM